MKRIAPIAVVIDQPSADRARPAIVALGGAWETVFKFWHATGGEYLVMLAHTKKRIRLKAPLTFTALSDAALTQALQSACGQLDNTTCQWLLFLEPGSAAEQVAQRELLRDMVAEARA